MLPERFNVPPPDLATVMEWQAHATTVIDRDGGAEEDEGADDDRSLEILVPLDLLWQLLVFAEAGLRFPALLAEAALLG